MGVGTAFALSTLTVAAAHKKTNLRKFPLTHGMLRASAETIAGPRPCDWFDVFVDDHGSLVALLMDVHEPAGASAEFLSSLLRETRSLLGEHARLHVVVNELELQLATHPGVEVGLIVLRISQRDAKVELLNAGMPPVANAGPGVRLELYPALSGPIGQRVGEVHPYELLPLSWGSTWLAVSDGMLNGAVDAKTVPALCAKLDLAAQGQALVAAGSHQLYDTFQRLLTATRFLRDDASGVLVGAYPGTRFQSGIV